MGSHFGVGEFTTHFRTYFSWDWDVHWGYDLDFDPWPFGAPREHPDLDSHDSRANDGVGAAELA